MGDPHRHPNRIGSGGIGAADFETSPTMSTEKKTARATPAARIKPPMGHDNAWWWEHVANEGAFPIQR